MLYKEAIDKELISSKYNPYDEETSKTNILSFEKGLLMFNRVKSLKPDHKSIYNIEYIIHAAANLANFIYLKTYQNPFELEPLKRIEISQKQFSEILNFNVTLIAEAIEALEKAKVIEVLKRASKTGCNAIIPKVNELEKIRKLGFNSIKSHSTKSLGTNQYPPYYK